ncbi:MAG: BREX-3 system P-loop-containing protein BrxF [Eubacteriales bacterium]|jgi:hypothetical protein|nr:BREX-3 system P-loop-containing protein BrxF [Eubacteriales bacterium]
MGTVIERRDLSAVIKQALQGVFVLAPNVTVPVNASVVNVGLLLGERMFRLKTEGSPNSITRELDDILGEEHRDILLKNTDILFSPEYGLDVIKLLLQLGRNQRFYLPWPGELVGERLTYSEPSRFDFKEYNVKDYVDTYVVLR